MAVITSNTACGLFAGHLHSRKRANEGPVTRAIRAMETEPEPPRRGFLRGLISLPLIGGGVNLIGAPTAVAEPVTPMLLRTYSSWLWGERVRVLAELYPDRLDRGGVELGNLGHWFHHHSPSYRNPPPSTRAALVLSTVGCDWER